MRTRLDLRAGNTRSAASSPANLTSTPNAGEYVAAYIRKASDCLKFHRKLGHASTEKAGMTIPLCKGHNFVPGDMRRYMPVCPTCWLNSFDHRRVRQVTGKIDHTWLKDFVPGEVLALDGNDMGVFLVAGTTSLRTAFL